MYMLIRYPVGVIVEAVVLAKGRNHMRVAAQGSSDTIELKRSGQQWYTASQEPVEFEFLMSSARQGVSRSRKTSALAAGAAGTHTS